MHIDNKIVSFSSLEIPDWYEPSLKINLNKQIYIPILANSKNHKRFTYGFSSQVLETLLPGLEGLVLNEGTMQLVFGQVLKEKEYKKVKEGLEDKENGLEYVCLELLEKLIEESKSKKGKDFHLRLLSHLIGSGKLDIKFAFKLEESLRPYQHSKLAIFEGIDSEEVAWSGSNNLSNNSSEEHLEDFSIFQTSRVEGGSQIHIPRIKDMFERMWKNEYPEWGVASVSSKFYKTWKEAFKAPSKQEIKTAMEAIRKKIKVRDDVSEGYIPFPLRVHQKKAIQNWVKADYRGILDHATGSGKTYTAIRSIHALRDKIKQLNVIIGVPYISLADQWEDQLNEHFYAVSKRDDFSFDGVIACHSDVDSSHSHFTRMSLESLKFKESIIEQKGHLSIFVVVQDTLFSEKFNAIITEEEIIKSNRLFFIGDECHNYSSIKNISFMDHDAKFRLGLSATAFDSENNKSDGEKEMESYFGEICDRYSLKDGIDDGHLCEYYYKPIECYLDKEEYEEWQEYLDKYISEGSESDAFKEMEKIIDKSKEKYQAFKDLLSTTNIEDKQGTIIFCGQNRIEDQRCIDYVASELDIYKWKYHRITYKESREERKNAIKGFERGDIKALTAVRVLDEGIDIPSIKTAILLASSERRRQFIQRRGRVLRNDGDKTKIAEIYDFIILPSAEFSDRGKSLLEREISRVKEMGGDAINKDEIDGFVENWRKLYGTV